MASKGKFRNRLRRKKKAPQPSGDCEQRLKTLSWELTLAAAEVLKEKFGFTTEQINEWSDLMLKRAKAHRMIFGGRRAAQEAKSAQVGQAAQGADENG